MIYHFRRRHRKSNLDENLGGGFPRMELAACVKMRLMRWELEKSPIPVHPYMLFKSGA